MASTSPILASTASSAVRLLWMSDSTAMRTETNLAAHRSPRPASAHARIARIRRWDAPARGGDHQPMPLEAGHVDRHDDHRTAAERVDRPFRGGQLGPDVTPFPGDQAAARSEQREREL